MSVQLDAYQEAAWRDIEAGHNCLVTGPAGTGKSALMQHIISQLERTEKKVLVTALTGQAGELIGGVTLHSAMGYKLIQKLKGFHIAERREKLLAELDVLIIDECSMLSAEFLQHLADELTQARLEGWMKERERRDLPVTWEWRRWGERGGSGDAGGADPLGGQALQQQLQPHAHLHRRQQQWQGEGQGQGRVVGGGTLVQVTQLLRPWWQAQQSQQSQVLPAEAPAGLEGGAGGEGEGSGRGGGGRGEEGSSVGECSEDESSWEGGEGGELGEGELRPAGATPGSLASDGEEQEAGLEGEGHGAGLGGGQHQHWGRRRRRRRRRCEMRSVDPTKPLAGLQIIFSGDFLQLQPVVKDSEKSAHIKAAKAAMLRKLHASGSITPRKIWDNSPFMNRGLAFQAVAWRDLGVRVHELKTVHRQGDRLFIEVLHAIRAGEQTPAQLQRLRAMCCRPLPPSPLHILPTELFARNQDVDAKNSRELAALPGPSTLHCSHDYVAPKHYKNDLQGASEARRRVLLDMKAQVLGNDTRIPRELQLKQQAQVMLCVNLCMDPYLVNGSRGVVVGMADAREERARLERQIDILEATVDYLQMDDSAFGCTRRRGRAARPSWLANAASVPAQVQPQQEQPLQSQSQPATPSQQAVPAQLRTSAHTPPTQPEPPRQQQGQAHGSPSSLPSPNKRRLDFESVTGVGQQLQRVYVGAAGAAELSSRPAGAYASSGCGSSGGPAGQAVGGGGECWRAEEAWEPLLLQEPPPQQLLQAAASQTLPLSQQPTQPLEQLFGPQEHLPVCSSQPGHCWDAAQPGPAQAAPQMACPRKAAGTHCWQPQPAWPGALEQHGSGQHLARQWAGQPGVSQLHALAPTGPVGGANVQTQEQRQYQFLPLPPAQSQQQQQQQPGPGWDSFPYQNEPVPKQLFLARQELKALVALLRARGEVDVNDKEVDDVELEQRRGMGGCEAWRGSGSLRAGPPWAAAAATLGGGGGSGSGSGSKSGVGQGGGGQGGGGGAGGGRLMLPVVQFQSHAAPIVVKPRVFRHRVRNLGDICRIQYPLVLAWAISIHKSQGASLDLVRVNLKSCFAKGQVYVALSRARSMQGLEILNLDESYIEACPMAKRFYASDGRWHCFGSYPEKGDMCTCFFEALRQRRELHVEDLPHYFPRPSQPPSSQSVAAATPQRGPAPAVPTAVGTLHNTRDGLGRG